MTAEEGHGLNLDPDAEAFLGDALAARHLDGAAVIEGFLDGLDLDRNSYTWRGEARLLDHPVERFPLVDPVHPDVARAYADAGGEGVPDAVRLTGRPLRSAAYDGTPPGIDPSVVIWPEDTRKVTLPGSPSWTDQLDVMVVGPDQDPSLTALYAWAVKAAAERMLLEELAAVLVARGEGAPGVLLFRYPDGGAALVESEFIPSGTLILSRQDHPDLMVKVDPDGPGVLYYRQGKV